MARERIVMLSDSRSYYASVEKDAHPELRHRPVAVGDPGRMSGIILAACPIAKAHGVAATERVGEALAKCPDLVVIRPRMQRYITISLLITEIYERITDQVEPFSIDEQFLDVSGSLSSFGPPDEIARLIQSRVKLSTGVESRIGIGPTKILAKMANNLAKRSENGVFRLGYDNLEKELWQRPIDEMFMVGSRMTRHFMRMGLAMIGDIARLELSDFKRRLRREMRKQSDIMAEYYWQTARGIDPSPVEPAIRADALKSVSHGKALRSRLYRKLEDIDVVLLELALEVCSRARRLGVQGRVVAVGAVEDGEERATSFGRQTTLPQATALTHEVAAAARRLFVAHWKGEPVSRLYVSLTGLGDDSAIQLDLFEDRAATYELERATDRLKNRYGSDAVMRASSLLESGVARERAEQIGGHYR
ncbi:DNA polymerase IV [Cohnella fermenti]|uniref:DNA polymerase IV n=1 Tax=Cohnella fermenti TaxID=2565925 RepID=A0A4S4BFX6_9BACL|nr:DNA polymerase IV [Cohnella fermenti]THF73280.1 DNA polymerase IV [Cohnella fermenti]